jgi:pSer/pThr/pTyr-binding forkhead associated (FHA) protein
MASRARRALAAVEEQMGAGHPGFATGGAKTRVLGFHAPDLATDPISAVAEKSQTDVLFPAGWLVVVDGPGRGAYFAVSDSVSSIGRGEDQAICLNFGDATVSRQNHAAIAYDAEQNRFFLGHGNKSNIVRRNGMPVLSTEEILNGDTIRIGKTSLRFVALCGPDFRWDEGDATRGRADD